MRPTLISLAANSGSHMWGEPSVKRALCVAALANRIRLAAQAVLPRQAARCLGAKLVRQGIDLAATN